LEITETGDESIRHRSVTFIVMMMCTVFFCSWSTAGIN